MGTNVNLAKNWKFKKDKPLYLFESRSIPPANERPKALNLLSSVEAPILCENEDMFKNETNDYIKMVDQEDHFVVREEVKLPGDPLKSIRGHKI